MAGSSERAGEGVTATPWLRVGAAIARLEGLAIGPATGGGQRERVVSDVVSIMIAIIIENAPQVQI